jgi:hypothetical protein
MTQLKYYTMKLVTAYGSAFQCFILLYEQISKLTDVRTFCFIAVISWRALFLVASITHTLWETWNCSFCLKFTNSRLSTQTDRVLWSVVSTSASCSGKSCFQIWVRILDILRSFVIFLSHSRQMLGYCLKLGCVISLTVSQVINHSVIWHYIIWALESVVGQE